MGDVANIGKAWNNNNNVGKCKNNDKQGAGQKKENKIR